MQTFSQYTHTQNMNVDISGLDKVALLHALWSYMESAVFFKFSSMSVPTVDTEDANKAVSSGHIDYFSGRLIKTDLRGPDALL